jgi:hypothetical protein
MRASPFVRLSSTLPFCALLCACGPDAVTAAATSATTAAAAARQAQEDKARLEAQIKAMQEAEQKRVDGLSQQVDNATR